MDKDSPQKVVVASQNKPAHAALNGALAGLASGIILQPLDVLKVNLILLPKDLESVKGKNFLSSFSSSIRIISEKEGIKGFFRGVVPSTARGASAASIFFTVIDHLKVTLSEKIDNKNTVDFLSSATARTISSITTNPFTVMKTRAGVIGDWTYSSMGGGVRHIYKHEGVGGFFKGSFAMILRDFPFGGIFYVTYNHSNIILDPYFKTKLKFLVSGMIAGITATTLTQPIEIVKAKLMVDTKSSIGDKNRITIVQHLGNLVKEDGVKGLGRGLFPRLIRKPVINAATFFFYEIFNGTEISPSKEH